MKPSCSLLITRNAGQTQTGQRLTVCATVTGNRGDGASAISRGGFTLIELAAVMLLMALFASLVAVSLKGHLEKIRFDAMLNRIESIDRAIRLEAVKRNSFLALQIDVENGRIARQDGSGRALQLGAVRIDRLQTRQGELRHGTTSFPISPRGQSESYALRLRAASGRTQWLLICGLSGQAVKVESDADLKSLLAVPAGSRADAG